VSAANLPPPSAAELLGELRQVIEQRLGPAGSAAAYHLAELARLTTTTDSAGLVPELAQLECCLDELEDVLEALLLGAAGSARRANGGG
jgi:hypothetical protein